MLNWFVDGPVLEAATKHPRRLIGEEEVEVRPEVLPDATIDEGVNVHQIRKYFTTDAWTLLQEAVTTKRDNYVFKCNSCFHDLDESPSIVCDHCLFWYHINFVGLKQRPKSKYWFCRQCH